MNKKDVLILSVIAMVVGAVFFGDQVLSIFRGMSPLEAMKFIVNFLLHVVVLSILSFLLYGLVEFAGPVMKLIRGRGSKVQRRRGTEVQKVQAPRLNTNQALRMFALKEMMKGSRRESPPTAPQDDNQLRF